MKPKKKTKNHFRKLYKRVYGAGIDEDNARAFLELPDYYTQDDLKKAYRRLAQIHHPDKGGEPNEFLKVQSAYELLQNQKPIVPYNPNAPSTQIVPYKPQDKYVVRDSGLENQFNGKTNEINQLVRTEAIRPLTKYEEKLKPELVKLTMAMKTRDRANNDVITRQNTNNSEFQKKILEHYNRILADEYMFNEPPSAFTGHGLRQNKRNVIHDGSAIGGANCGSGMKKKCANPWLEFLAGFRADHKGQYTASEMAKMAAIEYKK
jgi:hypothetical protein